MKYKLVNKEIREDYGAELLRERGVVDIDAYLHPTIELLQDPTNLENIEAGAELLINTLEHNGKILLVVDSDNDGFCSAAIMYLYIKQTYPSADITYWLHTQKQHGLEDHINKIVEENDYYDLIILPDSSSNDYDYHERLGEINIPCLVLDHHLTDEPISSNAVIINNQLSPDYSNKELTGGGVVYQFCRYLDRVLNVSYADQYIDLAAWAIIGDMGSVLQPENRYIIMEGLKNVRNPLLKAIVDKQSFSMKGALTPMSIAFYVVPLVNAMIRVGTEEEKTRLFEAFIDGNSLVSSNKRGAKGEQEFLAVESTRECVNARSRQNRVKEAAVASLEAKIHKYDLLSNKVLLVRLGEEDDFPAVLNGLVAMELSQKFKRPTIVARLNDEGMIRGSARGLNDSELVDFKEFLTSSSFFEYATGHANAFGVSINNSSLSAFHRYANDKLAEVDFNEDVYDVNFVRRCADSDIKDIVVDLDKYKNVWGQGCPEPLIYVSDVNITADDVQVIGTHKDTVKFEKFGVTYMKFFAKELIQDLQRYPFMKLEIVGKANLNEWMGTNKPQIFIESYEIKNGALSF